MRKRTGSTSSPAARPCKAACHPRDYDEWAALGNPGWGYEDVLPFFKRHEDYARGGGRSHGQAGELSVQRLAQCNPLAQALFDAAVQAGFAASDDFNRGEAQGGFGLLGLNRRGGARWSASRAFLHPVLQRRNLTLFTDALVVNGQRIWTTTWWGRYMFLAARTDADPENAKRTPHAGISIFIVPVDTPGITVRPATTMYDGSFANIFHDDVRIPADRLVGPVNGGWKVMTDALAHERALIGGQILLKAAHAFDLMVADLRADAANRLDPRVRERIGALAAEIEVGRALMLHCAELAEAGHVPPETAGISKVFGGELMERFGEAVLDLIGLRAALSQGAPGALRGGRWEQNLRHSLMWVTSVETNEIQRSLLAQRGLGLPR